MATIVLVHGIAQEQRAADTLETTWLPALAGGVRVAGFPEVADRLWRDRSGHKGIDARMAFYGHLFLRAGQQGADPGPFTQEEAVIAEALAEEWLVRGSKRSSNVKVREEASRELANLRAPAEAEAQGLRSAAREVARRLARIRWFARLGMSAAERVVNQALLQVTRYLTDDGIREQALAAVEGLVDAETQVVIGHSLGSVIAYEAAHRLLHPLPLFVTIGSPLGLETIIYQRLRPQPPGFPLRVRRWVNVADRDDLVAAEPDLSPMFSAGCPADAVFESRYTVDNGAEPHRADFYLSKAEVGRPVGEALSANQ